MARKSKAADVTGTPDPAPAEVAASGAEAFRQEIQLRAYYRYCERGCAPGADLDDWLAAEREVEAVRAEPAPSAEGVR